MVLAEALLRVPDADTADRLIEDKLKAGDWAHHDTRSTALLVSASAWTLGITARVIHPGETPEGIVEAVVKRLGVPAVRAATRQAMRLLGSHFVLGQTIEEALARAGSHHEFLYSFDMLGEGARTAADAQRYFEAYAGAIDAIGRQAGNAVLPNRPGISVKLSALHPRYEPLSRGRVLAELPPKVLELARLAKQYELNFTVDAEEADRLELSLDVIAAVLADDSLAGWDGFGVAVQAYQKRSPAVIDWIAQAAEALGRRLMVRSGQGCLLGHRDQTRAGARACRLSGVQPQGDDRPLLSRLRAQIAGGAPAALSAIRHPQCAHGRQRDRRCRRHRRLRIPEIARHGRRALSCLARRVAGFDLPDLCAGRRPCRSARLSGAPVVGERRQFLVSYRWRPIPPCRSTSCCGGRSAGSPIPSTHGIRISRCRAICLRRYGAIRPASNSATARRLKRCWPRLARRRRTQQRRR